MLLDTESEPASAPSSRSLRHRPPPPAPPVAEPRPFQLQRRADGNLWLLKSGKVEVPVEVVRCFPWSRPERFLSLRDREGVEQGFLENLDDLDQHSRAALQSGLERAAFVLDVTRVLRVEEDFELR